MMRSKHNELKLFKKAIVDLNTRNRLKKDMEDLAEWIVGKYFKAWPNREDRIQEGMGAFIDAFEHYKKHLKEVEEGHKKLFKFNTYFTWWAKTRIEKYVKINKLINS